MNLMGTPEFKVGLLVVIVSVLIGVMSMKVSESPNFVGGSKRVWFSVEDAGGLIKKSPVRVAGIRVGIIEEISLQDGKARVDMLVRPDVLLTESSKIEIRANGILGDKHVEIVPGSSTDPIINAGQQIMVVEDNASIDRLMTEVSKISQSLSDVVDNIRDATEGDASKPLGRIVKNIDTLTGDLAHLVGDKKDEISQLIDRLNNIAGTLDEVVNSPGEDGFKATWGRALGRIDSTLENIDEISEKINNGEGTIGRLVNDEATVEEINQAVSGINGFLNQANKLQTSFDYYSHVFNNHFQTNESAVRSYIGIRLQPGLDRFYEIAGISAPEGVRERFQRIDTVGGGAPITSTEEKTHFNRLKLTALFGKKFYNFSIKGGVMENTGGIGLEYNFWRNRFRASFDAFDFEEPHLRYYLRYSFFKGLYITGGQDHLFLDTGEVNSAFIGAGLFLTNDDIKVLLSRINF